MHLRTFTADTSTEAMALVREALGNEAIILATQDDPSGGVRVTAALETETTAPEESAEAEAAPPPPPPAPAPGHASAIDALYFALRDNSVPAPAADTLLALAEGSRSDDPHGLLAEVLAREYRFASLTRGGPPARPILLVGPPGAGKTQTAAKLAAGARLHGRPVSLISADSARTGASARLAAFAEAMGLPLSTAADRDALAAALAATAADDLVVVDTAGCNTMDDDDTHRLARLIDGSAVEPVLVLADGMDPAEAGETALAFAALGATRLIVTRTDAARRHGTPLAAAGEAGLALADLSSSPLIRDGLVPLDPPTLATLLLSAANLPTLALKTGT